MKNAARLIATAMIVAIPTAVFVITLPTKGGLFPVTEVRAQIEDTKTPPATVQSTDSQWLKGTTEEKFAQIETHLRGLDQTMAEIGYRYGELYFAARKRNWNYAKYQTEKIDLTMRLALERRPKRAASSRTFLDQDLPTVMRAIESKNVGKMDRALQQLHNSCIACHRSENVLHFREAVERIRKNGLR